MSRQSQKLSNEIRQNYKTTLRVLTETTDTSSKRYVLNNPTEKLINYELRRKMQQVGVQVQDVGSYLCWQAYVDEPGVALGIAELVHVAKPPTQTSPPLNEIPPPKPIPTDAPLIIDFLDVAEEGATMEVEYRDGDHHVVINTGFKKVDFTDQSIKPDFIFTALPPRSGYTLDPNIWFERHDHEVQLSTTITKQPDAANPAAEFKVHLERINFQGVSPLTLTAKLTWQPTATLAKQIEAENAKLLTQHKNQIAEEGRRAFIEAARERIKLASTITPRRYEDLREEERIVVYRALIQNHLMKDLPLEKPGARHAVSELVNSIFDVDKMLYFVAPEWWKARRHYGQSLSDPLGNYRDLSALAGPDRADPPSTLLPAEGLASWGGAGDAARKDNYYITENSAPAPLGASLGWLLQLDGDDLRNAFLNAPWVKAVIPIRPGKTKAALAWLQHVEGADGIGPTDFYPGDEDGLKGKTMAEALEILAGRIADKQKKEREAVLPPSDDEEEEANKPVIDDDNVVTTTPVDRVFEHGYDPLGTGFRATPIYGEKTNDDGFFKTFADWIEVLPTDQIVAVEVGYDPKTGAQLDL